MKILILGKGYIGNALNLYLKKRHKVTHVSKKNLRYDAGSELDQYLQDNIIDIVINASGYTGRPNVDACEDNIDDTWYYNVTTPGNIAETCAKNNVHLIHVSSGCIYDGYEKQYTESDEPNFGIKQAHSSWYSKTKHAGELALHGTGATILRIRMPFCGTTSTRNVIIKLLKYDKIINQKNSMTNVEDFVEFVSKLIHSPHAWGETYNVVNPSPVETSEIVNMLREYQITNPRWEHISIDNLIKNHTKTARSNCVLSIEKIRTYGYKLPETRASLRRCIKSIKNELDNRQNI